MATYAARGTRLSSDLQAIRDSPVHALVGSESVLALLKETTRCSYARGQEILSVAEEERSFCLVIEGAVGAALETPDGGAVSFPDREAGSMVEIGQQDGSESVLVARALASPTVVYVGAWSDLETAVLPKDPAVSELFHVVRESATEREVAVVRSKFRTVEQRIAAHLVQQAEERGADVVVIRRVELARIVSAARETVARVLDGMKERGLIEFAPHSPHIHILDRQGLIGCATPC